MKYIIHKRWRAGFEIIYQSLPHNSVWHKNEKLANVNIKTSTTIKSAVLDGGIFMDADESNNKWDSTNLAGTKDWKK